MRNKIVHILSLNGGNLVSVINAFEKLDVTCVEVRSKADLENATHLVIPGIGHYDRAMNYLKEKDLVSALKSLILEKQLPTLGICLGMHLLATKSAEGKQKGLGIFDASVEELQVSNSLQYKIPHNGWNTLVFEEKCKLFEGITETDEFFFLHKYVWKSHLSSEVFASANYERNFPVAIGKNKCWGVQFHPEKSHDAGLQLLQNFIQL